MTTTIADFVRLAARNAWSDCVHRLQAELELATVQSGSGTTVLIEVAHLCPPEFLIEAFISVGGKIGVVNREGYSALHAATDSCQTNGAIGTIRLLVKHGAAVSATGNGGWTPLHFAARRGCVDVVETLVELGADLNAPAESPERETPLMLAARGGLADICTALVALGANTLVADLNGWTAAEYARKYGHERLASKLGPTRT